MARLKPSDEELEKVLIAARDNCWARLKTSGYDENSKIPEHSKNVHINQAFSNLDLEAIMPKHFAELRRIQREVGIDWAIANDNTQGIGDRVQAKARVETRVSEDPWIKNLLVDYDSAVRSEMLELKKEFKIRVKLGKKSEEK